MAKFGIALEWGSRGRWFESSHSDHSEMTFGCQVTAQARPPRQQRSFFVSGLQTLRWFAIRFFWFAATFYALHEKSLLTHFVAAPFRIVTAIAGSRFCFFTFLVCNPVFLIRSDFLCFASKSHLSLVPSLLLSKSQSLILDCAFVFYLIIDLSCSDNTIKRHA